MEKETKFLNAKEARARADFSYALKNRVYKRIKEASGENFTEINWCIEQQSEAAVNDLIHDLKADGYDVDYLKIYDDADMLLDINKDELIIKW